MHHETETGREVGAVPRKSQFGLPVHWGDERSETCTAHFESNALCMSPRRPPGELSSLTGTACWVKSLDAGARSVGGLELPEAAGAGCDELAAPCGSSTGIF